MNWTINPSSSLHGVVSMPGDKSISHRALMHAALAQGTSRIQNFLHAGVTEAMMRCVRDLGVSLETPADGALIVRGGQSQSSLQLGLADQVTMHMFMLEHWAASWS